MITSVENKQYIVHVPCYKCGAVIKTRPVTLAEAQVVERDRREGRFGDLYECAECYRGNLGVFDMIDWITENHRQANCQQTFVYWQGDDLYAVKVAISNDDDKTIYGLIVYDEAGKQVSNDAVLDAFISAVDYDDRHDEGACVILTKENSK